MKQYNHTKGAGDRRRCEDYALYPVGKCCCKAAGKWFSMQNSGNQH